MIIGIDPGFTGGIAFLHGQQLRVFDMPLRMYRKKKQVDAYALTDIFKTQLSSTKKGVSGLQRPRFVAIEDIGARPNQGIVSTSRFTYNAGVLLGVVAALDFKVIFINPTVWKPALGLSKDKKLSIALAKKLFPSNKQDFRLLKHDGRAEAALIAYFAGESL